MNCKREMLGKPRTSEIDTYRPKHIIFTKCNDNYHGYLYKPLKSPQTYKITHDTQVDYLIIPFTKMLSNHRTHDMRTSDACHEHNFHRRNLKFSDIVSNTITIMNKN